MYREIKGDLITLAKAGEFDAIVHGCNCMGSMGKGIAKTIKNAFPLAAKIDLKGAAPGTINAVLLPGGLFVINAYTQIYYGKAGVKYKVMSPVNNYKEKMADTEANRYRFILSCMKEINRHFQSKKIGLPLIGCGLAGGRWDVVRQIICEELKDCDVTIVHYRK